MSKSVLWIRNWDRWQTYRKDRGTPPWIKLYRCVLEDPDWVALTDAQRGQLVCMWMLAANHGGSVPNDARMIMKLCQMEHEPNLNLYQALGFLIKRRQPVGNHLTPQRQRQRQSQRIVTKKEVIKHRVSDSDSRVVHLNAPRGGERK
jgi:hypothetical protein